GGRRRHVQLGAQRILGATALLALLRRAGALLHACFFPNHDRRPSYPGLSSGPLWSATQEEEGERRFMTDELPTGRVRRALSLAKVGAQAGASWAVNRGSDAAARSTAEVLGNLRGLAAKVGQT